MAWCRSVLNKIKFFLIALTDAFKYLCCTLKQRRKLSTDFVPLSSVGVVPNDSVTINPDNGQWIQESYPVNNSISSPKSVQDYIAQYRQQKLSQMQNSPTEESPADFFQDMEPKIMKQKKLMIGRDDEQENQQINSRLSFNAGPSALQKGNELASWEEMENTGAWDIENENTDELLKEKRRIEREKRLAENMKKRMEKDKNRIASKIS
ncbi:uncharacterized protein LOC135834822 [Planococcus citri]|uniref:uncharacterized protein LOC135834822 n=1 Tax=Planococcus citri TaxID=170843 RepID=UPI0031F9C1E5